MKNAYRQMLIDEKTHAEIDSAKRIFSSASGRKLSAKEVIGETLGRRLRFIRLKRELRNYINAFVSKAAADESVVGLLLFGSVAKGNFTSSSDIDVLVVVDSKSIPEQFERITKIIDGIEEKRKPLIEMGLHLRLAPMLLPASELKYFRPIYLEFLEDGVVLFERNEVLSDFLNDVRGSVRSERRIVNDSVVMTWSIGK